VVVNKRELREKWKRNADFNKEQARQATAADAEAKLNRAWGGGKTADHIGKKLRPVDRVAKRVVHVGARGEEKAMTRGG
jgi:hypothetical protein